jgi:hypothetical protein
VYNRVHVGMYISSKTRCTLEVDGGLYNITQTSRSRARCSYINIFPFYNSPPMRGNIHPTATRDGTQLMPLK